MRKIVKVEWYDACQSYGDEEFLESLEKMEKGQELLAINTTYGQLIDSMEDIIVIIHEASTSTKNDYSVIPRGWIKKMTTLVPLKNG